MIIYLLNNKTIKKQFWMLKMKNLKFLNKKISKFKKIKLVRKFKQPIKKVNKFKRKYKINMKKCKIKEDKAVF